MKRLKQFSSQPLSGVQMHFDDSSFLAFLQYVIASPTKTSKKRISKKSQDRLRRILLLCVFFHSSGFGCPGGNGQNMSNGNLKFLPFSMALWPANIGNGKMDR